MPYEEDFGSLGLEDVGASDLVLPRLQIDHDNNVFVNSLTKETFPALTVVILGLVKQRIMWPDDIEDGDKPMCKSPDAIHGFPRFGDNVPKSKSFPWDESNYTTANLEVVELEPGEDNSHPEGWSSNGYGTIKCDACVFAKWGKNADGKNTPPPCSEQHTYPLHYMVQHEDGSVDWIPALFTVQRSAIKNSRSYINSFAQARKPMFTVYTGLTLRHESRGKVKYSVPEFKQMSPTDRDMWGEYGNNMRQIRTFVRSAPRRQDDDGAQPPVSNNENKPPAATAEPPAAEPTAPTAPPAPPAAEEPPTPPAPTAPASPPSPPKPPSPPVSPQPTTSAAPPPASGDDDDEGLPF